MEDYGKPLFPEDTPEEIIFALAGGDIDKIEKLNKTKYSTVQKLIIIKSKNAFIEWHEMPEPPEESGNSFGI